MAWPIGVDRKDNICTMSCMHNHGTDVRYSRDYPGWWWGFGGDEWRASCVPVRSARSQ
jgi:hypothetical protein